MRFDYDHDENCCAVGKVGNINFNPKSREDDLDAIIKDVLQEAMDSRHTMLTLTDTLGRGAPYDTNAAMHWFKDHVGKRVRVNGKYVTIMQVAEVGPWRNKKTRNRLWGIMVVISYRTRRSQYGNIW